MSKTTQPKMVPWYSPKLLMRTAYEVAISTILARHNDRRLLETLTPTGSQMDPHDYTSTDDGSRRDDILIDYLADTGDGWDSTYAVACSVAHPNIDLNG